MGVFLTVDVMATLELALRASGLVHADADRRPRLRSDNGPFDVANDLSGRLEARCIRHVSGKPNHPVTQEMIERSCPSPKSRILLECYHLPGNLERAIDDFVDHYNYPQLT